MKKFLCLLSVSLLSLIAAAQTTTISRPSLVSVDSTGYFAGLCQLPVSNIDIEPAMTAVYTGKSGAGPQMPYATMFTEAAYTGGPTYAAQVFTGWPTPTYSYVSLTLSIYALEMGTSSAGRVGQGSIKYSLDNGLTWSLPLALTNSFTQVTINITGGSPGVVQVLGCVIAPTITSTGTLEIEDIWITGIGYPNGGGSVFEDGELYRGSDKWVAYAEDEEEAR
jgi:hypothetical protein